MLDLWPGDIIRLKSLPAHTAPNGRVHVLLLLGTEAEDGSEPLILEYWMELLQEMLSDSADPCEGCCGRPATRTDEEGIRLCEECQDPAASA